MKFCIDENIPAVFRKALSQAGYEVVRGPSSTPDIAVLRFATKEKAVVVTFDADFRRLVLTERQACAGVIWLRHVPPSRNEEMVYKLLYLVKKRQTILSTSFIILTPYDSEIIRLK
jgi:predicted nuclease of predicted toxin-antitoxin system